MKPQQFLVGVLFGALLALSQVAEGASPASTCDASACVISSNCRCSSAVSPLDGDLADWPQLISLTFDEAVTEDLYNSYWNEILLKTEQKNPDGEFISATFFVPHEYTNYKRVNDLYNYGFEIAVHSISKNPLQEYWRTATEDLLTQEFGGQKEIISKFANIPKEAITGVRTPQLQLAGNNSIAAYVASELSYDSSWPSLNNMFPYTLDYASTQPCLLGAECPNEAFPGFWVLPINDLRGPNNTECNTLATCGTTGTAEEIKDWLVNQIETVRTSSKTPMNLLVNSYWFNQTENSLEGFKLFLSEMQEKSDVYFVSQKQVMEFIKNPVQLSDFKTDPSPDLANCNTQTCRLKKGTEDRNMVSCVDCPDVYPWIGNPDGTN